MECKNQKKALCGTKTVPGEEKPSDNKPSASVDDLETNATEASDASSSKTESVSATPSSRSAKAQAKSDASSKSSSAVAVVVGLLGFIPAWV